MGLVSAMGAEGSCVHCVVSAEDNVLHITLTKLEQVRFRVIGDST